MKKQSSDQLTNRQKAAVILTVLGPEVSGKIIRHLDEDQIEILSLELARLEKVNPDERQKIIDEFYELALAQDYIAEGGVDHARQVLLSAFGEERANEVIKKVVSAMQVVPFEFLRKADPSQILSFIQDEHPQTIALILAWLPVPSAAIILGKLPTEIRSDVAARIAMMEQTPPEYIRKVEQVLEKKVSSLLSQDLTSAGGPKALVDLLNRVDRSTERMIIDGLIDTNPELAEAVKNIMFVFEDIVQLDDRAIQAVLREVDTRELATSLKGVTPEVQEKIFKNMSERAVSMLKEDMEFMGPVRMKVVEEAQQKFVSVIRKLEESGDIILNRGGEEEMLV